MEQPPHVTPDNAPDKKPNSVLDNESNNIIDNIAPNFTPNNAPEPPSNKTSLWLKRLGIGGFLFFLGKGLLWLFLGKAALDALCNWVLSHVLRGHSKNRIPFTPYD